MGEADKDYEKAAELVYEANREMHKFSIEMQGHYGKWLISSLLFLHGAAIGGLLSKWAKDSPPPFLNALWWFVIGIILALAAGFAAWWNFTFLAQRYWEWADFRMLNDRAFWPKAEQSRAIDGTLWCAVICGVLSVVCLFAGAAFVACSWR